MMIQTPKRSSIPSAPTPFSHPKSSTATLPPLSSILNNTSSSSSSSTTSTPYVHTKLPSIDSFTSTPLSTKYFQSSKHYLPPTLPTPTTINRNKSLPIDIPPIDSGHNSDIDQLRRNSSTIAISTSTSSVTSSTSATTSTHASPTSSFIAPTITKHNSFSNNITTTIDKSYAFISHSPATYPSQEPSIDNAPLARRKRRRTSPNELSILNQEFDLGTTPNKARRLEIAAKVSMTEKAVQIWFQNRRQSIRKQSNNEREVTELPSIPIHQHPHHHLAHLPPPPTVATIASTHPLVSSTPTKPIITKSLSFVDSPNSRLPASSPIKQRATSIPILPHNINNAISDNINKELPNNQEDDESNSSIDDSMILHNHHQNQKVGTMFVLNETKKKQPLQLNSINSSTMTFKLIPSITSPTTTVHLPSTTLPPVSTLKPQSQSQTSSKSSNIHNILNNNEVRKPLGQLNSKVLNRLNTVQRDHQKPLKNKNESNTVENKECAENLLSLRLAN